MLVIRSEQMRLLGLAELEVFKQDLARHLAGFAPELFALRGESVFRAVVDQGVSRAARYGFTHRGPLRFFVECMVAYGVEFDTDVQIQGLQDVLVRSHANGQQWHADQAFAAVRRYQIQTRGRDNAYAIEALRRLGAYLAWLDSLPDAGLEAELLQLMASIHPEKFGFVGPALLGRLITQARQEAARHGIEQPSGVGLLCGLMFALGHGITRDPLYPWVNDSLAQPPARDAAWRIESLRRKTRLYLTAVLDRLPAH
ncbi:MAG: hypothetical protein KF683_10330 [Rubrivivax sp.]|nr:hypothetical protein [Rubrivivax sp.]